VFTDYLGYWLNFCSNSSKGEPSAHLFNVVYILYYFYFTISTVFWSTLQWWLKISKQQRKRR